MLRRSGPLRRTGFKRPTYVPPPRPPVTRGSGGAITRVTGSIVTIEKENPLYSVAYQALVRKMPCARCGIEGFTQFCHSDEGKGLGMKTDDRRGWPGCGLHPENGALVPGCHWLVGTSGQIPRAERRKFEADASRNARAKILLQGLWPKSLPVWEETDLSEAGDFHHVTVSDVQNSHRQH